MKEIHDYYFHKAKAENYPARSVYKLKELDAKFHLIKKGARILDLGAAPGSWSLGCAEKVGSSGIVVSCDIQQTRTSFPPNVKFFQEDIFSLSEAFEAILKEYAPFDMVISDMAPATTGSRFTDQARSYNLAQAAFELASSQLAEAGTFITKIFMGPDVKLLEQQMNRAFRAVKSFKPKSSRSESKEIFLIGLKFHKDYGKNNEEGKIS